MGASVRFGAGALHDRLYGGLWHTTHPDRFLAILTCGCLCVNPDIPNSERWKASRPEHYPFVRTLGGISLFDFSGFDPAKYELSHPMSNWHAFVPYVERWGGAVWIEVDREAVSASLVSPDELVTRWDQDGNRGHTIMPRIEAAHIGDIPTSAFRSAFLTWAMGDEVREVDVSNDNPNNDRVVSEWKAFCGYPGS